MKDLYDTGCMFRGGRVMLEVDRDESTDLPRPRAVYEYNAWITRMMEVWNRELGIGD